MADLMAKAVPSTAQNVSAQLNKTTALGEQEFLDSVMPKEQRKNEAKAGELIKAYKDHLKFEHSGETIVNLKSSQDFYRLKSDKSGWEKISTDTTDKLTNSANARILSELVKLKTEAIGEIAFNPTSAVRESGTSPQNASFQLSNLKLPKLAELATPLLHPMGNLISILPSAEDTKAAVTPVLENQLNLMANNRLTVDPHDALKLMKSGIELYHNAIKSTGVATDKDIEDGNLTIEMMDYSKELLGKPIENREIPRIKSMLAELDQHYSPERIEAFREAMDTGFINGKAISKEKAKFHFDGGQILNAIKEGKYNTPEGKLSEYGFDMVHTLKYGELEKDLKQWF